MLFLKKYEPLFLFILIVPVLLLRMNVESTNYCTPDSRYYLEVSQNILSGEGFNGPKVFDYDDQNNRLIPLYDKTPFGRPDRYQKEYFAVWPLGYPVGIVALSYVTNLSPLWASKILNILLLAIDFYLLYLIFSGTLLIPLYYFCSFTMLEICSYTWSENLFLTFFLLFIISIKRIDNSEKTPVNYLLLFAASLLGMTIARYASAIFYVAALALMIWYYVKKDQRKTIVIFWGLTIATTGLGLYLLNNYIQSGFLTGMPRVNTQDFTALELVKKFLLGIFNQLHIIKQFRFTGTTDFFLYLFLSAIQLGLMGLTAFQLISSKKQQGYTQENKILLYMGFLYLFFLIYMTFTSTIDPFDYRTLLPFSFPVFMYIFSDVEKRLAQNELYKNIWAIKLFFIASLFINLPKKYLLDLLFNF